MTHDEDSRLVERAQKGDAAAYRLLLERHYSMMFRVAYRFTGHRQDAEDIAQDVCVSLASKLAGFRRNSRFTTWLYRVIVNACRDMHKHRSSVARSEDGYMEMESLGLADDADTKRKVAWIYHSINGLESTLRETALLVLAEELSHAEVAIILGCKESTISWRMHKVRAQLKQAIGGYHD